MNSKTEAMTEREKFKAWARSRGMSVAEALDSWCRPKFAHEHVESIWFGWQGRASTEGNAGEVLRELVAAQDEWLRLGGANNADYDSAYTQLVAAWSRARSFAEADKQG